MSHTLQDGCLPRICMSYNENPEFYPWEWTVGRCGNRVFVDVCWAWEARVAADPSTQRRTRLPYLVEVVKLLPPLLRLILVAHQPPWVSFVVLLSPPGTFGSPKAIACRIRYDRASCRCRFALRAPTSVAEVIIGPPPSRCTRWLCYCRATVCVSRIIDIFLSESQAHSAALGFVLGTAQT